MPVRRACSHGRRSGDAMCVDAAHYATVTIRDTLPARLRLIFLPGSGIVLLQTPKESQMKVSADHICPKYGCVDREVRIGGDDTYGFYVSIAGYGCSKNYKTARNAVYAMLQDHACTNIRITED